MLNPTPQTDTYTYDSVGNQIERGNDTFQYDHENRLVESVIDSVTSTSVYNGDGLRMSHTMGFATKRSLRSVRLETSSWPSRRE